MLIGICDDCENDRTRLRAWLDRNYSYNGNIIIEFPNGEALLEHLRHRKLDIVFFDGKMTSKNGIETACKI